MNNNLGAIQSFHFWLMVVLFITVLLVSFCSSCGPRPGPPVDPEGGTSEDCAQACAKLEELGCPGHEGSPGLDSDYGSTDDVSCTEVCETLMQADKTMTLMPACTAKATSCEEVEACFMGEER